MDNRLGVTVSTFKTQSSLLKPLTRAKHSFAGGDLTFTPSRSPEKEGQKLSQELIPTADKTISQGKGSAVGS